MLTPLSTFAADNYEAVDRKTVLAHVQQGLWPGCSAVKMGGRWYVKRDTWASRTLQELDHAPQAQAGK